MQTALALQDGVTPPIGLIAEGEYFVATLPMAITTQSVIAGMICLTAATTVARITHFFVDPLHRRQGIGTKLLRHAIETARDRGVTEVDLTVHPGNKNAQWLFRAHNFKFSTFTDLQLINQIRLIRHLTTPPSPSTATSPRPTPT